MLFLFCFPFNDSIDYILLISFLDLLLFHTHTSELSLVSLETSKYLFSFVFFCRNSLLSKYNELHCMRCHEFRTIWAFGSGEAIWKWPFSLLRCRPFVHSHFTHRWISEIKYNKIFSGENSFANKLSMHWALLNVQRIYAHHLAWWQTIELNCGRLIILQWSYRVAFVLICTREGKNKSYTTTLYTQIR